jgi:hypothetical protein
VGGGSEYPAAQTSGHPASALWQFASVLQALVSLPLKQGQVRYYSALLSLKMCLYSQRGPLLPPTTKWEHYIKQTSISGQHCQVPALGYALAPTQRCIPQTTPSPEVSLPEELVVLGQTLRSARCTSLDLERKKKRPYCWVLSLRGHCG